MNWIVTVCRNGLEMTKRAVESFARQDIGDVAILLIDNASSDGTQEHFENANGRYGKLYYMRNSHPWSVAKSWNVGIRWTLAAPSLHVMVVNNDTELAPWTYRLLAEDPAPFATARGVLTKEEMLSGDVRPEDRRNHPDFGCYVIKRECWDKVGPFDQDFAVAYCEDNDVHVRAHIAGVEAVSLGIAYAHYVSGTMRANPHEQEAICIQAEKNRERFHKKWGFRIPSEQINDGKYWEFFRKPRPDWKPFEPQTWIW